MNAEPISKYIATLHERDVTSVTLLGKGPSLDYYTPANGEYVMGINDVARHVRCDAALYVDSIFGRWDYPDGVTVIRPVDRQRQHGGRGYFWDVWQPGRPKTSDYLKVVGPGSGTKALGILGSAGVTEVTLWGFDGGFLDTGQQGYADCLKGEQVSARPGSNYASLGRCMLVCVQQVWSSIQTLRHGVPQTTMIVWSRKEEAEWATTPQPLI